MADTSQEAFEKYAESSQNFGGFSLRKNPDGSYFYYEIQYAFESWQASEDRTRLATQEEDAAVADQWANSESCHNHDENPCCHVRTGASIAEAIRARKAASPIREGMESHEQS